MVEQVAHNESADTGRLAAKAEELSRRVRTLERRLEELRASRSHLQDLYENSPDLLLSLDPYTGRILECNETAVRRLGYSGKEELVGLCLKELVPQERRHRVPPVLASFLRTGSIEGIEMHILTREGQQLEMLLHSTAVRDSRGRIVRSRSALKDIHLLKDQIRSAERAVLEKKEMLELVLDGMAEGVIVVDPDSRYLLWNRAALAILGIQEAPRQGSEWSRQLRIFRPDGRTLFPPRELPLSDALRGRASDGVEMWVENRAHSGRRLLRCNARTLYDGQGEVAGAVLVFQDVTEERKDESRLEHERVRRIRASRISSLGKMARGVAHEINNPLEIIRGYAEQLGVLLASSRPDRKMCGEAIEAIIQTVERISQTVTALRSVSGAGTVERGQPISLAELLREVAGVTGCWFQDCGVRLEVEVPEGGAEIEGRAVEMAQVLIHLLDNAREAARESSGRWVRMVLRENEAEVEISVEDSGAGVDPELRGRIMEPFFTTRPVGQGAGLGLSVASSIVEDHGGTLELDESCPNTRFVVKLSRRLLAPQV